MAELGADLSVASKQKVEYKMEGVEDDEANTPLFKIAYKIRSKDMLSLMMTYKPPEGENNIVQATIKARDII